MNQILEDLANGRKPKAGPQSGRCSCEPHGGLTSLTTEPPGPGVGVRSDL